jgi:hypothetical protein
MTKKFRKKQTMLFVLISFAILLIAFEMFLRLKFGLGNTVLYRADAAFEYIAVPQQVKRFGNTIFYNQFSQRNRAISSKDSVLVDFFGDSVLNGGAQTDNGSLATSLLSEYWTEKYRKSVLALNISAGSWGPDNCFAYLKKYGDFGAKQIVLVVSSHDAYDNMDFISVVGVHPSFPDKQPLCAISEFVTRYLPRYLPAFLKKEKTESDELKDLGINKKSCENRTFNEGFEEFYEYCKAKNTDLTIYLHADKPEWKNGKYNEQGQEIIAFCNEKNIKLIKELDFSFPEKTYRDGIHLSKYGQLKMFETLKDALNFP